MSDKATGHPHAPPSAAPADADVERFIQVVQEAGRTGVRGDGMIVVTDVEQAIRIRDSTSGEEILARSI